MQKQQKVLSALKTRNVAFETEAVNKTIGETLLLLRHFN
jgi:hypothetical protein